MSIKLPNLLPSMVLLDLSTLVLVPSMLHLDIWECRHSLNLNHTTPLSVPSLAMLRLHLMYNRGFRPRKIQTAANSSWLTFSTRTVTTVFLPVPTTHLLGIVPTPRTMDNTMVKATTTPSDILTATQRTAHQLMASQQLQPQRRPHSRPHVVRIKKGPVGAASVA